jgi:L-ascorbate metabolism protein UlaG (beta-lactamase superfamily)
MHIKPHIHRGRFYNDANDSGWFRLKKGLRFMAHVSKSNLINKFKGISIHPSPAQVEQWIEKTISFPNNSQIPVVTWLGHATFLIQINDINILTDPVFYNIPPIDARFLRIPFKPERLPPIHAVLISHNHRDHLDEKSIQVIKKLNPSVHFYVPSGNKKWFEKRDSASVFEASWGNSFQYPTNKSSIDLTFLPASHWTSRTMFDFNKSLWGSWMITTHDQHVYFAGDTAYAQHFKAITEKFGPINIALMPIGQGEPQEYLKESHMNDSEAIQAFLDLNASNFIPMHWGTFSLGTEPFAQPIERLQQTWALQQNVLVNKRLHVVKLGESRKF